MYKGIKIKEIYDFLINIKQEHNDLTNAVNCYIGECDYYLSYHLDEEYVFIFDEYLIKESVKRPKIIVAPNYIVHDYDEKALKFFDEIIKQLIVAKELEKEIDDKDKTKIFKI